MVLPQADEFVATLKSVLVVQVELVELAVEAAMDNLALMDAAKPQDKLHPLLRQLVRLLLQPTTLQLLQQAVVLILK